MPTRLDASATAITWLPFEALERIPAVPLELAVAHYDEPPPERAPNVDELRSRDAFREANELRAWIEVEGDAVLDFGQAGRALGGGGPDLDVHQVSFAAVEFPVIQPEPEMGDGWVRFTQTAGGRIGLPAPKAVPGRRYFHIGAVTSWTTLELLLRADGTSEARLAAASPFPRHSIYGSGGELLDVHGSIELQLGEETPWEAPVFAAAVESELERRIATSIVRDGVKLERRRVPPGGTLVEQGDAGRELFVLLDGVLDVEIDGVVVAQVGSGAILGERAVLGDGRRTATLRAVRACRLAVIDAEQIAERHLRDISRSRTH